VRSYALEKGYIQTNQNHFGSSSPLFSNQQIVNENQEKKDEQKEDRRIKYK
jgi:hypothetical protein